MTTFWIDAAGALIEATSDAEAQPPGAAMSTTVAPESGKQKWNFTTGTWDPLPAPPPPPTDAERADSEAQADPLWRAWVSRQARIEGKTPRQIIDELQAELP